MDTSIRPLKGKLIRDKIPEILQMEGKTIQIRIMDEAEYQNSLKQKLLEETLESINASSTQELTEELADLFEVIYTLLKTYDISPSEVEKVRLQKREKKGGFEKRIYSQLS